MRYLSVCSGIEAATQAWHPLGWRPVAFSEIEPFPCAVLKHHYPEVPNWGDMTKFQEWPDADVDVLCGGTPCQSFSVAGLRQGLADPRGNLALTFLAIAARYRPRWVVWENVPGVYSATSHEAPDPRMPQIDLEGDGGPEVGEEIVVVDEYESDEDHAFACFLAGLQELGYGIAYGTPDAQYVRTRRFPFAVPQRRKRVFVVGYFGDWRRAAAVLFDRESLSGHPAPRREAGQGTARGFETGPSGGGFTDLAPTLDARCKDGPIRNQLGAGVVDARPVVSNSGEVGYCLTASAQQSLDAETETLLAVAHALRGEGFDASEDGTGRGTPIVPVAIQERAVSENLNAGPGGAVSSTEGCAYTLEARQVPQAVAWSIMPQNSGKDYKARQVEVAQPLMAGGPVGGNQGGDFIQAAWQVRRLTPVECERLQGFPDNFTRIPYRNKPAELCPDGPRYKALGNSWAVNCAEWIGERMAIVESWSEA